MGAASLDAKDGHLAHGLREENEAHATAPNPGQLGRKVAQPCRFTISLIQIGAKGEVQPLETG